MIATGFQFFTSSNLLSKGACAFTPTIKRPARELPAVDHDRDGRDHEGEEDGSLEFSANGFILSLAFGEFLFAPIAANVHIPTFSRSVLA